MTKKTDRKTEVAAMARRANGVTVAQIQTKTAMLPHSARALLSGIKKALPAGEELQTTRTSAGTVYKIVAVTKKAA